MDWGRAGGVSVDGKERETYAGNSGPGLSGVRQEWAGLDQSSSDAQPG